MKPILHKEMKIKCPIFDPSDASHTREFENSTSLFRHLMNEHTNHAVSSYCALQIFKIHEKIERLGKKQYYDVTPDSYMQKDLDQWAITCLQSLLENKK